MKIRNRETGEVTTISQFKASYPNTSFPKQITADTLDSFGYDPVLNGAAATVTAPYGVSVPDGVEQIDGQWFTKFIAGPVFANAEEEAEYRAQVDADVSTSVRKERNRKLTASDWTQLADSSANTTDWASYRQALRDLPSTDGFPHNITWPTEPS